MRRGEHLGAPCLDLCGATEVHVGRRHETDSGMPMLVVVPVEERPTELPGVNDRTETLREVGPILERLELRLGVRCSGSAETDL
jgi:hypothetical protein